MKTLKQHINEALKIGNNLSEWSAYSCQPKTKHELLQDIVRIMRNNGSEGNWCDLNEIDTSLIEDMSNVFAFSAFHGNISRWNVSNVKNMSGMFSHADFNGDISKWDVSNVKDMSSMFRNSKFNQPIGDWDISSVENMSRMFYESKFKQDISKWDMSNVKSMDEMFRYSKFNKDISNWNVSGWNYRDVDAIDVFDGCKIREKYKPKAFQNLDI